MSLQTTTLTSVQQQFASDIDRGLSDAQKWLPSKYFYDSKGDRIFQEIMAMPEYYLTNCEFEILSMQKQRLAELFSQQGEPFQLIEFGAGDGTKTKVLLSHFLSGGMDFTYMPIDISGNVLEELSDDLKQQMPDLHVSPINNDYFRALESLSDGNSVPKVILFMGANIGNFKQGQAGQFLSAIAERCQVGDLLMVGFDLKKDPRLILQAYNDPKGITRAFNFNLLHRINHELGGTFDLSKFQHYPCYDPVSGETKSYLISLADQTVSISATGKKYHFQYAEPIYMELSKKFSVAEVEGLAAASGFKIKEHLFDCKHYFLDSLWEVC